MLGTCVENILLLEELIFLSLLLPHTFLFCFFVFYLCKTHSNQFHADGFRKIHLVIQTPKDGGDGMTVQTDLFHLVPNSWGYYESTSRDTEDNIRESSSSPHSVQCTNINGVTVIIAFMHEEVHFLRYLEGLREMKRRISTLWLTKDRWKIAF